MSPSRIHNLKGCAEDEPERKVTTDIDMSSDGCSKDEPEKQTTDGNDVISVGCTEDEPEKKKTRSNKLEKDDRYNTKLTGADFFKWAKAKRQNKQSAKGKGKNTGKGNDYGKGDHTLEGADHKHAG